jgi:hypothetical protein
VDVTVGTFNLNNLFGRWTLYADVPASPPTGAQAPAEAGAAESHRRLHPATDEPRWDASGHDPAAVRLNL